MKQVARSISCLGGKRAGGVDPCPLRLPPRGTRAIFADSPDPLRALPVAASEIVVGRPNRGQPIDLKIGGRGGI